jgi:NitT/TauT family transport system substrate-binding protein
MSHARSTLAVALLQVALCSCGWIGGSTPGSRLPLRLGYFPNITHATALVGIRSGLLAQALGPGVVLRTSAFNAGPPAIEALLSGSIDASYVGPNPALTAYLRSHGRAVRVIAGATSGGASLVVRRSIHNAADLRGRTLATPQLGNTQDVALRWWLRSQGLRTNPNGGGDVLILPQDNAQTLQGFRGGLIDGAWVPEPWASRLVFEGGAHVLVDEATLWPDGRFVSTLLVVRTDFLRDHPAVVQRLLAGHIRATDFVSSHPTEAQQLVNDATAAVTGLRLSPAVVAAAWSHLTFTTDPIAPSLGDDAMRAETLGLLGHIDLHGLFALAALNQQLASGGKPSVAGL